VPVAVGSGVGAWEVPPVEARAVVGCGVWRGGGRVGGEGRALWAGIQRAAAGWVGGRGVAMNWLAAGAMLALGSDSHVCRQWPAELRLLEDGQRLALRQRNVAAAPQLGLDATAARLFNRHLSGGAMAAGFDTWGLVPGARADLLVVDTQADGLAGVPAGHVLAALGFAPDAPPLPPLSRLCPTRRSSDLGAVGQVPDCGTGIQVIHDVLLLFPDVEPGGLRVVVKQFAGTENEAFIFTQTHPGFLCGGIGGPLAQIPPQPAVGRAFEGI